MVFYKRVKQLLFQILAPDSESLNINTRNDPSYQMNTPKCHYSSPLLISEPACP